MARFGKVFYISLGWLFLALGFLGIIMPILPTTPFLLCAVWAFSRSSPEMAARIRNHPTIGPPIRDWQDHGVIPVYGKVAACLMMGVASLYLLKWSPAPFYLALGASAAMLALAVYILSRPSKPGSLS